MRFRFNIFTTKTPIRVDIYNTDAMPRMVGQLNLTAAEWEMFRDSMTLGVKELNARVSNGDGMKSEIHILDMMEI